MASLGKVPGDAGRKQESRKLLEELEERSKHRYISPYLIALVQMGLGEKDRAIASLEQGYANRDQWMLYLKRTRIGMICARTRVSKICCDESDCHRMIGRRPTQERQCRI